MASQTPIKCTFCDQEFTEKKRLNFHLKTALYCLERQGKQASENCKYCLKPFSTKYTLAAHSQNCVDRVRIESEEKLQEVKQQYEEHLAITIQTYEEKLSSTITTLQEKLVDTVELYEDKIANLIEQHETQLQHLKERLADKDDHMKMINKSLVEVAKQKTVTTNITTNNNNSNQHITKTQNNHQYNLFGPLNLSQEHVKAIIDQHLTPEVIGDGQVGLANMIHAKLLTNEQNQPLYVRTDINRNHFGYQNAMGEFVRDPKAQTLKKAILTANVGAKAIDTVRSVFAKDAVKLNAYLPMALEINSLRHKDAKFRQQLTILAPDYKGIDDDSDDDDEEETDHTKVASTASASNANDANDANDGDDEMSDSQ